MKSHTVQLNFLSGVLSPEAKGRTDTDAYSNGLLRGVNVEPVHLGGIRRRRGTRFRAVVPNQITRISSDITPTAPNGGTAANANDNNEASFLVTSGTVGTTDPYVVVHYDLGSAKTVLFADAINISSTSGSSTHFCIQYSTDDSNWTTLGSEFEAIDTSARNYRKKGPVTARYWRVAKIGGTNMGAAQISLASFDLWFDSGVISEGRLISFEVATTEQYQVVLTDHCASVYRDGVFADYQPMPFESEDLADVDAASDAETMILVHEDYAPRFLIRESPTNFQQFLVQFEKVQQVDYGDSLSPTPTSDVQAITFSSGYAAGDTFQISISGDKSASCVYAGDNDETAANIAEAVQAMWIVNGFSGVTCQRTSTRLFTVTLAGASADAYDTAAVITLSSQGTATVSHSITGVARREPVWSATRGWPRTVEFFQGRLYFGGTKSKQQSLIGSQVNNILNLDVGEGLDDDAIFTTLNGRLLNAIQGLFAGRSLQMFASGGEFRYAKEQGEAIVPSDAPVNQTQYGSAKVRPVSIDGSTLYVQRNRKSIRDFRFDYTQNAYDSLGVSALAPHLIYDVRDMAAWNGSAIDEINFVLVVNGVNPVTTASDGYDPFPDGTIAVFNSRKEAQIKAWTIWTTPGEFKAVATVFQDMYFLVERNLVGVRTLCFEQGDPECYMDSAIRVTNSPASTTVTGLEHLDGVECRVRADGFVLQNVVPSNGSVTLEMPASNIEVGMGWSPEVTPMPLQSVSPLGTSLMRKKRIVDVRAKVRNTLGLLVNGRPIADRAFNVDRFNEAAVPYSGVFSLEESTNWDETEDKVVTFSQEDPLPFELLAVDVQMETDA
jgi:hypothetical protein